MVQWWAMKSQPGFAFGSTAVYLKFWQPFLWAKVFIGLFVWYWPDPQQLESAAVISHRFSETQGAVMICPSWRSGPQYERDHIIRETASLGSKSAEPSSLPSGFAAWGVDMLKGGEEGKTLLNCYLALQPCTAFGWGDKPLCGILSYFEVPVFALDNAMHFCILQHPTHINQLHHRDSLIHSLAQVSPK